jgi:hypothetical protein
MAFDNVRDFRAALLERDPGFLSRACAAGAIQGLAPTSVFE